MPYFFAFLVALLGFFMVWKTEWFLQNFGRIDWAEEHLGTSGGTRLGYKLVGLIFIIGSVLSATGALGEIVLSLFGSLFGIQR
jgi:hypothetical protein